MDGDGSLIKIYIRSIKEQTVVTSLHFSSCHLIVLLFLTYTNIMEHSVNFRSPIPGLLASMGVHDPLLLEAENHKTVTYFTGYA